MNEREETDVFKDCHFAAVSAFMLLEPGDLGSGRLGVAHQVIRSWESPSEGFTLRDISSKRFICKVLAVWSDIHVGRWLVTPPPFGINNSKP